jgi:cytochrome c oxidase assembly factor CtaG
VAPSPTSWEPAWDALVVVVPLSAAYALAAGRDRVPRWRAALFALSQVLLLAVYLTPLNTLALDYLLSAHLLQNVVAAEWAPALAVLGLSAGMAARLANAGPLRALTKPLVALPLWLVAYAAWHVPALYEAALRNGLVLLLEHVTYFVAGALLWWPVLQERPRRLSPGGKSAYLFAAFVLASPLGLLLALAPSPLYDFYEDAPRIWGLEPLADQQIAGVVMTVSEAIVFFSAFVVFFLRFMAEEDAGYSHRDA